MGSAHDILRARLYAQAGMNIAGNVPSLDELRRTEWSPRFEQLMRNRLVMGSFRYGRLHEKGRPRLDIIRAAKERLAAYEETGNLELLVDVANFMLVEFEIGGHPLRHWAATDDGPHVKEIA